MNPERYPRRILLCVAGLSPQIVTETLYALTVIGEPRFVPTEIHLLTTAEGAERARLTVLRLTPISFAWLAWFARRALAGLPPLHWKRIGPTEVEAFLAEHQAALHDPLADADHPLIAARRAEGIPKAFFEERASKLKRELSRALGEPAAGRYTPRRQGGQRLAGHALGLEPHQIRFDTLDAE